MKFNKTLSGALLVGAAQAQSGAWGQCGGNGWTGPTTCISGYTCTYSNDWYSQCLPGSNGGGGTTPTTTAPSQPTTSAPSNPQGTGFRWLGVDESGAEFGQTSLPGVYGKDFTFASTDVLGSLMNEGYNIFRVPFLMERMAPGGVASAFDQAYLANYSVAINYITSKGGYAVVDPHNFGRYNGAIITDTNAFGSFWKTLATAYSSNSKVIFDTNNEYHDMDQTLVLNLNQAAITNIRAAGATSQYIFVEGNSYSGAWTWTTVNDNLKALTDPQNKIVYEMHQYLDSDGSGTSADCVSTTIGVERVTAATAWLRANGKIGIIGEYAGGANSQCMTAVTGMLSYMKANSDVWTGALWWGGGPWWGTYIYSFEPPSGTCYTYYDSALLQYKP